MTTSRNGDEPNEGPEGNFDLRTRTQLRQRARSDYAMRQYIDWRNACIAVSEAYAGWGRAGSEERRAKYRGYIVALDREEQAAARYGAFLELCQMRYGDGQLATMDGQQNSSRASGQARAADGQGRVCHGGQ